MIATAPIPFQIFYAWDGQKDRPHVVLGHHAQGVHQHITALAVRTRRRPVASEIPGWVPVPAQTAGLTEDSVVTLALQTFRPVQVEHEVLPPRYVADVIDNVRVVLGLPPERNPEGPTFFQYLLPPAFRTAGGGVPKELFNFLRDTGWSSLRAGAVYRDHGWHPAFDARDRFFLVVSANEFHDRFPFPLTWIVPVFLGDENDPCWGRKRLEAARRTYPDGSALFADIERVHSVEASQQWFVPCDRCRAAHGDAQSWRMPRYGGQQECVRCDRAKAQWPEEVAVVSARSLKDVRESVARYLGVL